MAFDPMSVLEQAGGVLRNRHFVYTSGKHGSAYINLDTVFPDVGTMASLCDGLVEPFRNAGVQTVAAPATGGIVLCVLAARALSAPENPVRAIWADKAGAEFVFERAGYTGHIANKRVLVVEDLLNTGGSVAKVCRLVENHGGELVGASVICNRGGVDAAGLRVKRLEALTSLKMDVFAPEACPLCAARKPVVVDISHGEKFREQNPDYSGGFVRLLGD